MNNKNAVNLVIFQIVVMVFVTFFLLAVTGQQAFAIPQPMKKTEILVNKEKFQEISYSRKYTRPRSPINIRRPRATTSRRSRRVSFSPQTFSKGTNILRNRVKSARSKGVRRNADLTPAPNTKFINKSRHRKCKVSQLSFGNNAGHPTSYKLNCF